MLFTLRFLILSLLFGIESAPCAEGLVSITVTPESLGEIVGTNGAVAGTGFAVGNGYGIVTCSHVVTNQKSPRFHFVNAPQSHIPMTLSQLFPKHDLALLRLDGTNKLNPLPIGDIRGVKADDQIIYVGWHTTNKALRVSGSKVTVVGVERIEDASVNFITFQGEGMRGYSGGPVFNGNGEVIAVMREQQIYPQADGTEIWTNRAFSVAPIVGTELGTRTR